MPPLTLTQITKRIDSIPTLSEAYYSVSAMLENPKVSASDVAQEISCDPALTVKLLKIVNSAFYGLPQQVSTLTHALVLLGFSTVKSLILAMSLSDIFSSEGEGRFPRRAFWTHCFATGLIAKSIATRIGYLQVEEVFIQGLLHDIGKIVLDRYAHDEFEEVMELVERREGLLVEAEQEAFGFTHAEVGAFVLKQWNLPKNICEVTALHHRPAEAGEGITETSIVHLADILCRAKGIGSGGDRRIPVLDPEAWKVLGLEWSGVEAVMAEAESFADCGSLLFP
ncbi:MAG: HDOD domain-containing protein [Planctomycetota bacterium]|jgi:putative nucleotidyltransferase with HDIG domain